MHAFRETGSAMVKRKKLRTCAFDGVSAVTFGERTFGYAAAACDGVEDTVRLNSSRTGPLDLDPDSVDGRPTFEAPIYDRGAALHPALCRSLEPALEGRAAPFLRRRFGHKRLALCNALVRRYLPSERREHPAHFDAHAAVTLVVGLNDGGEYEGGYYVQPDAAARSRRFVALERAGDAVCHTWRTRHGVECRGGTRYSLVTWWKPRANDCRAGTAPWYEAAARGGDADACYNVAAHRMRAAGLYTLRDPARLERARLWYERGAGEGGLQLECLAIICFKESIHTSRT